MRHRIGDCRRSGTLRGFARAGGRQFGVVEQLDFNDRYLAEFQDGVMFPVEARDAAGVELHLLFQRPARRLNRSALDLVDHAVGVDDQADIDRKNQPIHAHLTLDLYFGDRCAVSAKILVFGESDAVAASFDGFPGTPPGASRCRVDDRPAPRILEMPQGRAVIDAAARRAGWSTWKPVE